MTGEKGRTSGWRRDFPRLESGPLAHPSLTGNSTNPTAHPQRLRETLVRGRDYDSRRGGWGTMSLWNRTHNPTREPSLREPTQPAFLKSMHPEYSLHPGASRVRGDTRPSPGSLSTRAGEAENHWAVPPAPGSLQSCAPPVGCSARLCPTGTSTAPRAARLPARPPQPRLPGRERSDPLRKVNGLPAACSARRRSHPIPIRTAEAALEVGLGRRPSRIREEK